MFWNYAFVAIVALAIFGFARSRSRINKATRNSDSLSDDEFLMLWNDTYPKNPAPSAEQARRKLRDERVTWIIVIALLIVGLGGHLILWFLETMGIWY